MKGLHLHDLRREFASQLAESAVPIHALRVVDEMLRLFIEKLQPPAGEDLFGGYEFAITRDVLQDVTARLAEAVKSA